MAAFAVAGAELEDMSAEILEALRNHCDVKGLAITIEEYGGQFDRKGAKRVGFKTPAIFLANTGAQMPRVGWLEASWSLLCVAKQENRGARYSRLNGARVLALTAARVIFEIWKPTCGKVSSLPTLTNLYDDESDRMGMHFFSVSFDTTQTLDGTFTDANITDFLRAHGEAFMTDDQDDGSITGATELQTP